MACVTLLSDLGLNDPGLAVAKGVLAQHIDGTPLVDISHSIEPFHTDQAAYVLRAAYRHFEPGTCHIILFNVFSERAARMVYCIKDRHHFLAPDNGILPQVLGGVPAALKCYEAPHPVVFHQWLHILGRAAHSALNGSMADSGFEACELKSLAQPPQPEPGARSIDCTVIHIDRFENVVLNITQEQFEAVAAGRPFRIRFMRNDEITTISHNYYEVPQGEKLCRFNSAGHLEICINGGRAASLFGFRLHREQNLMYRSIKILFG